MNREQLILGTLLSLFDLASDLGPDESARLARLAGRLGAAPRLVQAALEHLEDRGLVDAHGVRLTLRGLAVSAAFRAKEAPAVRAAA
jgi:Mn-dependent DtxR family transcriptional regulator